MLTSSGYRCVRTITLLLLTGVGCSVYDTAQDNSASNGASGQSGPSLKDTASWIERNLVGVNRVHSTEFVEIDPKKNLPKEKTRHTLNVVDTITAVSMNGCVLTVTKQSVTEGNGERETDTEVDQIPVEKLDEAKWSVVNAPPPTKRGNRLLTTIPTAFVSISLEASTDVITASLSSRPISSNETSTDTFKVGHFDVNTDDPKIAPRLVNAFKHAIQLCHATAKPDPF